MCYCLDIGKQIGAKEVILFTNHVLASAIRLYEKFNFKKIPLDNNKYIEADLKMKLCLHRDE
jgi:ribosomal protein S18 acetylase RimI-like enzyme